MFGILTGKSKVLELIEVDWILFPKRRSGKRFRFWLSNFFTVLFLLTVEFCRATSLSSKEVELIFVLMCPLIVGRSNTW